MPPTADKGKGKDAQATDADALVTLPSQEELEAMTPEQLDDLETRINAEAEELRALDPSDMTDEQADRYVQLPDMLDALDTETARREQVAAERQARVDEATQRMESRSSDEGDDEGDEGGDGPDEGGDSDEGDEGGEVADTASRAVAAGGQRGRAGVRDMARRRTKRDPRPADDGPRKPRASLIAAADVPGISAGAALADMTEVAKAFIGRSQAFPLRGRPVAGVYQKHLVASIHRDFDGVFGADAPEEHNRGLRITEGMDEEQQFAVLTAAADPKRLPGGGLLASRKALAASGGPVVASGGWCAPSETRYDLTSPETLDGIVNLPEIGVSRGGVRFTEGPDFAEIFTSAGFHQTEAEAIAGDTKDCVEITCPDFDEVRLDAVGVCIKAPLLTNAAYPELVQRWISGTGIANEHKIAGRLLTAQAASLATGALDYTSSAAGTPLCWGLLSALELQIEAERQARRLSESQEFEVILPRWTKYALRADLANRNFVGMESVSDAAIMAHFADRKAAVQFVLNWQELTVDNNGPKAYPTAVTAMVYAAGTFVKGTADVINLSTVYDTADLQTNVFTAAFVEDGVLLAKMRPGGRKLTFPVIPSGVMAAAKLDDAFGSVQS